MTEVLFAVRLEAALRVKPFVSVDECRYYLNGIHVRPSPAGGALCEATDGRRLGVRHDPSGLVNKRGIIRVPKEIKPVRDFQSRWLVAVETKPGNGYVCIVIVRGLDDKGEPREDTAENAIALIDDCEMRFRNCVIDGTFPDCDRVLPVVRDSAMKRQFNGEYMKTFGKNIAFASNDESSPTVIKDTADPLFFGVLMPMQLDERDYSIPSWIVESEKSK